MTQYIDSICFLSKQYAQKKHNILLINSCISNNYVYVFDKNVTNYLHLQLIHIPINI